MHTVVATRHSFLVKHSKEKVFLTFLCRKIDLFVRPNLAGTILRRPFLQRIWTAVGRSLARISSVFKLLHIERNRLK